MHKFRFTDNEEEAFIWLKNFESESWTYFYPQPWDSAGHVALFIHDDELAALFLLKFGNIVERLFNMKGVKLV